MNLRRFLIALSGIVVASGGSIATAQAQTALDPVRSGWVNGLGFSSFNPINQNYIAGQFLLAEYRNFFVFDLTGVSGMITSATLDLYNPTAAVDFGNGYAGQATETYRLTSTSIAPGALSNNFGLLGGLVTFSTLGTGSLFASVTASSASNGQTLSLNFNSAGLAYLNANRGNLVAFGGRVSTLNGITNQYFFANTNPTGTNSLPTTAPVKLNLQVTPEVPAGVQAVPVLLAVAGMALYQRRKKAS
ncbi:MAG: hypothetical protein QM758_21920 [Armatimonas sp.]